MDIRIKTTNMELTDAIDSYVREKLNSLEKLLNEEQQNIDAYIEVGKVSNHHNVSEDAFIAEVNLSVDGEKYFARSTTSDLYASIDEVKDTVAREIKRSKGKSQTLLIRGARKIKKRIKGMKPWWGWWKK